MGTINYGTSDFLTSGLYPYDFEDIKAEYIEVYEEEDPADGAIYQYMADIEAEDMRTAEIIISRYNFDVFEVEARPGYYDGFYISVKLDCLYFWDEDEKKQAIKEAGYIRDLWQKIIDEAPCVEVWPGYCTTYKTYEETAEAIEEAYKNMLSEIEKTPVEILRTWTPDGEEVKA